MTLTARSLEGSLSVGVFAMRPSRGDGSRPVCGPQRCQCVLWTTRVGRVECEVSLSSSASVAVLCCGRLVPLTSGLSPSVLSQA
ncbi:hypothetical protein PoB_005628000 [Plakobranchus ocellatus]|uniref:Uncharacterized protein n=1 Tax=Plakobranchus ocellatus TaxID=259542 RepID=A0AAV4CEA3_9GAST|nr:hypothetical protein PoB_005628000 [Plakobranchus ocellatus]